MHRLICHCSLFRPGLLSALAIWCTVLSDKRGEYFSHHSNVSFGHLSRIATRDGEILSQPSKVLFGFFRLLAKRVIAACFVVIGKQFLRSCGPIARIVPAREASLYLRLSICTS